MGSGQDVGTALLGPHPIFSRESIRRLLAARIQTACHQPNEVYFSKSCSGDTLGVLVLSLLLKLCHSDFACIFLFFLVFKFYFILILPLFYCSFSNFIQFINFTLTL